MMMQHSQFPDFDDPMSSLNSFTNECEDAYTLMYNSIIVA